MCPGKHFFTGAGKYIFAKGWENILRIENVKQHTWKKKIADQPVPET